MASRTPASSFPQNHLEVEGHPASSGVSSFSNSNTYYRYDVFINHRGPDVKNTFASHFYHRLRLEGLRVFLDKEEMLKGENLTFQIEAAIRAASVHVAIFSKRYAESTWCLNELVLMRKLRATIIPVFYDVKPGDLRRTQSRDGVYAQALRILEEKKLYDSQAQLQKPRYDSTIIESWREALSHVAGISGFELEAFNGDEGKLLDEVVQLVLKKVKKPLLEVAKYPTGLDEKVKDFERIFLAQKQSGKPQVVGIVGPGGVGKTTLARELFNRKSSDYGTSCFLYDVREHAAKGSLIFLQRKLLEGLTRKPIKINSIDEGIGRLRAYISSCHALLILDDIDHVDQIYALLSSPTVLSTNSLVLITSRDKSVLIRSGLRETSIYSLTGLNSEHSQELFCLHAFKQPFPFPGFEYLVEEFTIACHGLPLLLKLFGAFLYGNNRKLYWEDQLDELQKIPKRILPYGIQSRLKIIYDALSGEEQQIFLDIGCFFIGEDRDTAIRIWDGSGWKGLLRFQNLENRCLVQVDDENKIRMHDSLRHMGRCLADASGLPGRLWRGRPMDINDFDELLQRSSVITGVRGLRMLRQYYDDDCASFSCSERKESQFLDIEDDDECLAFSSSEGEESQLLGIEDADEDHYNECVSFSSSEGKESQLHVDIEDNDNEDYDDECISFSSSEIEESQLLDIRELQLLDIEDDLSEWAAHSPNLIWLRWHSCPYYSLPLWISMKNLRVLEVDGSRLKTLWQGKSQVPLQLRELRITAPLLIFPKSIGQLKLLERIHVNNIGQNTLEELPEEFCHLQSLKALVLLKCSRIKVLPDSFGNLTNLEHIDLSGSDSLQILPNSFGNLIRLKYLDLKGCPNLTISYATMGNISSLEHLNLSACEKIDVLPLEVAQQLHLKKLYLSGTELKKLPSAIGDLSNFELLELGSPSLEMLPRSLGDLKSLQELSLRKCQKLKRLPDSVGLLTQLTYMTLEDCLLSELRFEKVETESEALTDSRNFQHLLIKSCHNLVEVGTLPKTLIKLEFTDCCNLRKIEGLCNLAKLEILNIQFSEELEELPSMETLLSLEGLRASGCVKLKRIKGLAQLTKLLLLDVSNCSELEELEGVEHCISLERLYASGCPKLQWGGEAMNQLCQRLKESTIGT